MREVALGSTLLDMRRCARAQRVGRGRDDHDELGKGDHYAEGSSEHAFLKQSSTIAHTT
jgi:hypothetical protein